MRRGEPGVPWSIPEAVSPAGEPAQRAAILPEIPL